MLELCPLSEKHKRDLRRRRINGLFETLEMGTLDFQGIEAASSFKSSK
jgi:hypothetical protein